MHTDYIINLISNVKDDYIIIGVSAGPDSMALLHMLKTYSNKKIVCAHINHNVRKQSIDEEKYLKEYCQKKNIIFECTKITFYKEHNFENEARKKRYAFYEEILNKYHSHTLFLAHHGDDLIETILMKIMRGSNILGYAGIKEITKKKNYIIIRPLLKLTKEDILIYNKENKIKYYIDKTNEDTTYTRNRYRKLIIPLLKKENINAHLKFLKYSNTLQEYDNYINYVIAEKLKVLYSTKKLDIRAFSKEHPFIKKQLIYRILNDIYNNDDNIVKEEHVEAITAILANEKPNMYISLPKNYQARKAYNYIYFEKKEEKNQNYRIPFKNIFKIDKITIEKVDTINSNGNDVCKLNTKNINLPLYVRNRKNGDYIELFNSGKKKKIKDIFIEEKIPINQRDTYPLIVDSNDNIIWIPFLKKSKYNVKNDELYDIILNSYKEREEENE